MDNSSVDYFGRKDVVFFDGSPRWEQPAVIQLVLIDQVRYSSLNPRKSVRQGAMDDLAQSIAEEGIREPVRLRRANPSFDTDEDGMAPLSETDPVLSSGHRRMYCAGLAGHTYVPAYLDPNLYTETWQVRRELIVRNEHNEKPAPCDLARAYRDYQKDRGFNDSQTARDLKVDLPLFGRLMMLLHLPEELQDEIDAERLSVTVGFWLGRACRDGAPKELVLKLAEKAKGRTRGSGRVTSDDIQRIVQTKSWNTSRNGEVIIPAKPAIPERNVLSAAEVMNGESSSVPMLPPHQPVSGSAPLFVREFVTKDDSYRIHGRISCSKQRLTDGMVAQAFAEWSKELRVEMPVHHRRGEE